MIKPTSCETKSGRRDLNPRPLDPQPPTARLARSDGVGRGAPHLDNALTASQEVWGSRRALAPVSGSRGGRGKTQTTKINDDCMGLLSWATASLPLSPVTYDQAITAVVIEEFHPPRQCPVPGKGRRGGLLSFLC